MEHRTRLNQQLTQWLKTTVETHFSQDISLVCIYGSFINGTMNRLSDVDCYFVPKTQRGYALARTFILEGVGYDIYPVTWERLEQIAALQEGMQPLVGDVQLLFSGSPEDARRFSALQQTLRRSLADAACTQKAAAARCRQAAEIAAGFSEPLPPDESLKRAGWILSLLAEAVALQHQDYFHRGTKGLFADLQRLSPDFARDFRQVIWSDGPQEALAAAARLTARVGETLGVQPPAAFGGACSPPEPGPTDAAVLAELYQEICSIFHKIEICSEKEDAVTALLSAGVLQYDLDETARYGCPHYPLLEHFTPGDLPAFCREARKIEGQLVDFIRQNGVTLRSYPDFDAFRADQRF